MAPALVDLEGGHGSGGVLLRAHHRADGDGAGEVDAPSPRRDRVDGPPRGGIDVQEQAAAVPHVRDLHRPLPEGRPCGQHVGPQLREPAVRRRGHQHAGRVGVVPRINSAALLAAAAGARHRTRCIAVGSARPPGRGARSRARLPTALDELRNDVRYGARQRVVAVAEDLAQARRIGVHNQDRVGDTAELERYAIVPIISELKIRDHIAETTDRLGEICFDESSP
mmetsp:Transcript_4294/g.13881  ORF Transcript_4294/g.13881 Transcript_4294/m.13881 type:complete len:225 (+) Transcript_4294:1122-1796(+)